MIKHFKKLETDFTVLTHKRAKPKELYKPLARQLQNKITLPIRPTDYRRVFLNKHIHALNDQHFENEKLVIVQKLNHITQNQSLQKFAIANLFVALFHRRALEIQENRLVALVEVGSFVVRDSSFEKREKLFLVVAAFFVLVLNDFFEFFDSF